jgi:hypothetical protein
VGGVGGLEGWGGVGGGGGGGYLATGTFRGRTASSKVSCQCEVEYY